LAGCRVACVLSKRRSNASGAWSCASGIAFMMTGQRALR
jgi:hypothetical protein